MCMLGWEPNPICICLRIKFGGFLNRYFSFSTFFFLSVFHGLYYFRQWHLLPKRKNEFSLEKESIDFLKPRAIRILKALSFISALLRYNWKPKFLVKSLILEPEKFLWLSPKLTSIVKAWRKGAENLSINKSEGENTVKASFPLTYFLFFVFLILGNSFLFF